MQVGFDNSVYTITSAVAFWYIFVVVACSVKLKLNKASEGLIPPSALLNLLFLAYWLLFDNTALHFTNQLKANFNT
jgi:hypothetical protein